MKYKKLIISLVSVSAILLLGFFYSKTLFNSTTNHPVAKNTAPPNVVRMDVPIISQKPELKNGCEVTSLAMLLNYKGVSVDKITLAIEMKKDPTPQTRDENDNIIVWGNPQNGFVGDVTGKTTGYSIDPTPLIPLAENYFEGSAVDLTNSDINELQKYLFINSPVIVWVTSDMSSPEEVLNWNDGQGLPVNASFSQHAVLLTGFDENNFYYNNPLSVEKDASISKEDFLKVWEAMGKKAFTVM